ncbi:nucleotidyltransferase family protein [Psychrobacter sp. 4Dc]|uniref:nucleotidyltransferase family protein n=1 Tax=Psychrobacter sp. 4Dc TaxID=888437 RepID=UPI000CB32F09|nr:nucleotidyltransferase family protein [Psychrobacter sp. 4Dc]PKH64119.1 nucleotidyltransferase family protein [Psychrobacter sp. 4Dc]|tara:strand:- start:250 stop:972 length:723 start_codon:yes stop_codon:yes gene_type:complete
MSKRVFTEGTEHTESTEQHSQNHAIIILASGLSQRLGQPKQLLIKNGEPLITDMTRLAITTNPQVIVIVIPDNHRLIASMMTELADQYPTVQIVGNSQANTGMAHSLSLGIETIAAIESTSIDRVLVMGVDQVLLDEPHLMALLAGEQPVVASRYHSWQRLEKHQNRDKTVSDIIGLPLAINCKLLRQWQPELIGDKGLRHLIRGLPADQIVEVDNDQLSYDIDTAEQLAYAKQEGWLDS